MPTSGHRRLRLALLALLPLVAAGGGGCANMAQQREAREAVTAYFFGDYTFARDRLRPLAEKTDQNFVLNNVRLGSAALADYDLDEAESAFLRAYEVMNSVGVNDGGRSLGAVLVDEGIRVWKGEPFERAMVNFYLGLVYYMRRDYANARAAFENALFKLRDYGEDRRAEVQEDEYRDAENDFALAHLMLAKCHQRLGRDDLAARYFDRAVELRRYLEPLADPELNEQSNVLLVVEFGRGPEKFTEFDGSIVAFGPHPAQIGPPPPPRVMVDGREVDVDGLGRPPVDLLALAQDRRWQSIDTIRVVKSAIGTGLIAGGVYEGSRRRGDDRVAAALILSGLALKLTSQADRRQWEMLPRTVYLLPLRLPPGRHDITVEFPDVRGVRETWRGLVVPSEGEATYYFRPRRFGGGGRPNVWPPPTLAGLDGGPREWGEPEEWGEPTESGPPREWSPPREWGDDEDDPRADPGRDPRPRR